MEDQKINVCRALASLFGEDPTEDEMAFVGRTALDLGLDESALKLVQQSIGTNLDIKVVLETIKHEMLQRFLFRRIVAATLIDEQLSEREQAVVETVVESFGWDTTIAREYTDHMKAFIEMEKKGEEIIGRPGGPLPRWDRLGVLPPPPPSRPAAASDSITSAS